jgi:uncharacterized membrane protein
MAMRLLLYAVIGLTRFVESIINILLIMLGWLVLLAFRNYRPIIGARLPDHARQSRLHLVPH